MLTFPMVLVGSLLSVHLLLEASFSPTWSIIGVTLTATLMLLGLERMIPHKKAWNGTNPHVYRVDVIHMLGTGLVAESWRALTFGIMFWCAAQLSHLGLGLWPNDWGAAPSTGTRIGGRGVLPILGAPRDAHGVGLVADP